uniref:Uncharacterized protein n=1 Tax=Chromera velia CCMP2878 TaxID=1169474 RepID=A0A0G4HKL5_9ALVE|eukprot:Cvel_28480.t1-p1 / transcript=Cvel_28480.t1 / gene=Cvel_28480 / organism=Chromera_velia_CCMP2878 / gene_product=hypothetical protein / transcript_product=hypothetical protein / location=Cvel_scaffold3737:8914-10273(+) / protein_length=184 / sequence_SO=supercontig / SO=protein_coding / is_pseudo=false
MVFCTMMACSDYGEPHCTSRATPSTTAEILTAAPTDAPSASTAAVSVSVSSPPLLSRERRVPDQLLSGRLLQEGETEDIESPHRQLQTAQCTCRRPGTPSGAPPSVAGYCFLDLTLCGDFCDTVYGRGGPNRVCLPAPPRRDPRDPSSPRPVRLLQDEEIMDTPTVPLPTAEEHADLLPEGARL